MTALKQPCFQSSCKLKVYETYKFTPRHTLMTVYPIFGDRKYHNLTVQFCSSVFWLVCSLDLQRKRQITLLTSYQLVWLASSIYSWPIMLPEVWCTQRLSHHQQTVHEISQTVYPLQSRQYVFLQTWIRPWNKNFFLKEEQLRDPDSIMKRCRTLIMGWGQLNQNGSILARQH